MDIDQIEELQLLSGRETFFVHFMKRLSTEFGDGEILPYEHIRNLFVKNLLISEEHDVLSMYIDTYRILDMLNADTTRLLAINNITDLIELHNSYTSVDWKEKVTENLVTKYVEAITPFISLSQTVADLKIELIATLAELNNEGEYMNHCIATYYMIIINKQYVGFRVTNTKTNERLTLGCSRNRNTLTFNQLKGNGNRPASQESRNIIIGYCNRNKITIPHMVFDLYYENYRSA